MFFETADHSGVVCVAGAEACVDDDVDCGKFMLMQPKRLPDQALDTVAANRPTDDFRSDRQAEACLGSAVGADKDREHGIGKSSRIFVDAIEVRFVMETLRRSKRPGGCVQERCRADE